MRVEKTLFRFDLDRYRLPAWRIMPNHVHVLIGPHITLSKITQLCQSPADHPHCSAGFHIGS